jgi:hypothetical protein
MISTDGGRKRDFNRGQSLNAPEARYQHFEEISKVIERRYVQCSKAELWICLTDAGIVIAVRRLQCENVSDGSCPGNFDNQNERKRESNNWKRQTHQESKQIEEEK